MKSFASVSSLAAAAALAALSVPPARGSGYEFEGLGTRQVSRAGAAVADADDWSAAYWNPAGLPRAARGGRELGAQAFGGWAYGRDTNSLSGLPGLEGAFRKERQVSSYILGGFGGAFAAGEKGALGFTIYTPLLQGAEFVDRGPGGESLDYSASAGIVVSNVSYGRRLSDTLSAGVGVGLLYGRIAVRSVTTNPPGLPGDRITTDMSGDGWGYEGTLGLRWDPTPRWSGALVYRTGADVDVHGRASAASTFLGSENSDISYSLRHPATSDVGVAFRPDERWTLTADLHQTYWSRFTGLIVHKTPGNMLQNRAETLHWRDTWKARAGLRRLIGEKTELLAGYSYDRFAVDAASVDFTTTIDAPMHRVSFGASRWLTEKLQLAAGVIGGYGYRKEGVLRYSLSGLQLMADARVRF